MAADRAKNVLRCSCGLEVRWGGGTPIADIDLLKWLTDGHSQHWYEWVEIHLVTPTFQP